MESRFIGVAELEPTTTPVVVIDVLRAFTVAPLALKRGADKIVLVGTVEEVLDLKARTPGSVAITVGLARWRRLARVTSVALPVLLTIEGLVIAPLAIPLLGPDAYVSYEQALGLRPKDAEQTAAGALPSEL